jgi:acyl-CoA thioesterase
MPKKITLKSEGFHPFAERIGLNFTKWDKGYSQGVLKAEKGLMNPHGVLHGAVIYAMADTGMGLALYTLLDEDELCSTVEIKINYFDAVTTGTLLCDTHVIHKGKRIAALESTVMIGERLVAKATGTYYIFQRRAGIGLQNSPEVST